jgi:hypothetical protein
MASDRRVSSLSRGITSRLAALPARLPRPLPLPPLLRRLQSLIELEVLRTRFIQIELLSLRKEMRQQAIPSSARCMSAATLVSGRAALEVVWKRAISTLHRTASRYSATSLALSGFDLHLLPPFRDPAPQHRRTGTTAFCLLALARRPQTPDKRRLLGLTVLALEKYLRQPRRSRHPLGRLLNVDDLLSVPLRPVRD